MVLAPSLSRCGATEEQNPDTRGEDRLLPREHFTSSGHYFAFTSMLKLIEESGRSFCSFA